MVRKYPKPCVDCGEMLLNRDNGYTHKNKCSSKPKSSSSSLKKEEEEEEEEEVDPLELHLTKEENKMIDAIDGHSTSEIELHNIPLREVPAIVANQIVNYDKSIRFNETHAAVVASVEEKLKDAIK